MGIPRMTIRRRPSLRVHRPEPDPDPDLGIAVWTLDGKPLLVMLWSEQEWAKVQDPPDDALRFMGVSDRVVWGRLVAV